MEEFLKLFSVRDILLHMLNTLILFVAIRFLVYKPVRRFMTAREDKIAGELDGAAQARAQADEALDAAREQAQGVQAQAARAQEQTALQAQQTGEEILAAARAQAEQILAGAKAEAERTRAAAREEVQAQALSMAVEIAEKMIGRELAVKDNETLAREFLTKVG